LSKSAIYIPEYQRTNHKNQQMPVRTALEQAGAVVIGDAMDIGLDLLPVMDLNRACRNDDSLSHLVSGIRAWLRRHR
jgi:hypothetical protein